MQVKIVGAGPGNPDYITVGGAKALQQADIILYDALANTALLNEYAQGAEWISVGKRAGKHSITQPEIHSIYEYYKDTSALIVRLKGGDPSVFARNTEEIQFLESIGITVTVVPGISAVSGIAADRQLPLTSRGVAESVWMLTGTTCQEQLSNDIRLAAKSSATLVFYMGVKALPEIMAVLLAEKGTQFPIAVIQNGTLIHEQAVFGTTSTILEQVKDANIGSPALIIAGTALEESSSYSLQEFIQTIPHEKPTISNLSERA